MDAPQGYDRTDGDITFTAAANGTLTASAPVTETDGVQVLEIGNTKSVLPPAPSPTPDPTTAPMPTSAPDPTPAPPPGAPTGEPSPKTGDTPPAWPWAALAAAAVMGGGLTVSKLKRKKEP